MAALKYSRQRESIKDFLSDRYDHPTADTVYDNIKHVYPHISLGTVYRNLALLTDLGEIKRLTTGDGKDHYDGNTAPHNHFVCKECGCVIDVPDSPVDYKLDLSKHKEIGSIDNQSTFFYGTCTDCMKKS